MKCMSCDGLGGWEQAGSAFAACLACGGTGQHPRYVKGDATRPIVTNRPGLIMHIVNDRGGWGRGFVVALSKRSPHPEAAYREWHATGRSGDGHRFELGQIQVVTIDHTPMTVYDATGEVRTVPTLSVVNMVSQAGYGKNNLQRHRSAEPDTTPPIRYDALEACLSKVSQAAAHLGAEIFCPKIGSGLAQGNWSLIEDMINRVLKGVSVTVYEL